MKEEAKEPALSQVNREAVPPYRDPNHSYNSEIYHTGKVCVEKRCGYSAGTAWSPYWCQSCNAERIDRISGQLDELGRRFSKGDPDGD